LQHHELLDGRVEMAEAFQHSGDSARTFRIVANKVIQVMLTFCINALQNILAAFSK